MKKPQSLARSTPTIPIKKSIADVSITELLQQALSQLQQGELTNAKNLYQRILQQQPQQADALHFLGVIAYQELDYGLALDLIQQALRIQTSSIMYYNLGLVFQAQEYWDKALFSYQQALELNPKDITIYLSIGDIFQTQGDTQHAIANYQRVLSLQPNHVEAQVRLADLFYQQHKIKEAISLYRHALSLQPDYANAWHHLGNVYLEQEQLDEAIACYQKALTFQPNYAEIYNNLGNIFLKQNDLITAANHYQQAVNLKKDYADAHFNLAVTELSLGHYTEAWPHYEYRLQAHRQQTALSIPSFNFPCWQGEALLNKKLLICPEQGYGDEIQFARYAIILKQLGAHYITLVCKDPLLSLFNSLAGIDKIMPLSQASQLVQHDYWIWIQSLPLYCKTQLENIPASVPYLTASYYSVAQLAAQLNEIQELKVGICWQGNPEHRNDKNRSFTLTALKPLFKLSGVKFFSLQPQTLEELKRVAGKAAFSVDILTPQFAQTAALIENLDLVISCDTSVAHLAGALAKPVWLVLPLTADWRWLVDREDSPWYPTFKLFRQKHAGDWTELFKRVEKQLKIAILEKQQQLSQPSFLTRLKQKLSRKTSENTPVNYSAESLTLLLNTAVAQHQQGNLVSAKATYQRILAQQPQQVDALHLLGLLLHQTGKHSQAIELITQAIALKPSNGMYANLALALQAQYQWDAAIRSCLQALELQANYPEVYNNLGNLFKSLQRLDEAVTSFQQAIAQKSDFAVAYYNLSMTFQAQGKVPQAIENYQQALRLKPDYAKAYFHLATAFQTQQQSSAAIASYEQALALEVNEPTLMLLAELCREEGYLKKTVACYQQVLALNPEPSIDAHYNYATALLTLGFYEEGWQHFAYRCHPQATDTYKVPLPTLNFPQWHGESLQQKSIVVLPEQGFGDEIQMSRYLTLLKKQGVTTLTLVCKSPLKSLFQRIAAVNQVLTMDEAIANKIPIHDYWVLSMSLPLYCQTTDIANIPNTVPYLSVDAKQIKNIAATLKQVQDLKVGICWRGNPTFINDSKRSPGIAAFKLLFQLSRVKFFNMQPDTREELLQEAGTSAFDRGRDCDAHNFEEAAALIMNLDLVISSCTSICHLAGALGKPVWIVLPFVADWRWLVDRNDSPWYPTATLFRQKQPGDWAEVFERVEMQLVQLIQQNKR